MLSAKTLDEAVTENLSLVIRAFWRRIYPYRNDFKKELPESLPVQFSAHMSTAMGALDLDKNEDGEIAFMSLVVGDEDMVHRDIYLKLHKAGYRLVCDPERELTRNRIDGGFSKRAGEYLKQAVDNSQTSPPDKSLKPR